MPFHHITVSLPPRKHTSSRESSSLSGPLNPSNTTNMAPKATQMCLAMAIVYLSCNGVWAQSGCNRVIMSLSPCLNYITGSSSSPSSSCCSQLASVVQSQPQCLCSVLNNGGASSIGININQTQALALPGACKVQTPPVSQCNGPAASPVGSAVDSPADASSPEASITPTASDIPSATISKTTSTPSTAGSISDGSINKLPFHLTTMFILYALSAIAITKG